MQMSDLRPVLDYIARELPSPLILTCVGEVIQASRQWSSSNVRSTLCRNHDAVSFALLQVCRPLRYYYWYVVLYDIITGIRR